MAPETTATTAAIRSPLVRPLGFTDSRNAPAPEGRPLATRQRSVQFILTELLYYVFARCKPNSAIPWKRIAMIEFVFQNHVRDPIRKSSAHYTRSVRVKNKVCTLVALWPNNVFSTLYKPFLTRLINTHVATSYLIIRSELYYIVSELTRAEPAGPGMDEPVIR
jgi:hypothetical protein